MRNAKGQGLKRVNFGVFEVPNKTNPNSKISSEFA